MMKLIEHHTGELQIRKGSASIVYLSVTEQQELLEALARIHGYSLVDHVERRSLMALTDQALAEHPDDASASAWRTLAKTLASTIADALRFENDKEV